MFPLVPHPFSAFTTTSTALKEEAKVWFSDKPVSVLALPATVQLYFMASDVPSMVNTVGSPAQTSEVGETKFTSAGTSSTLNSTVFVVAVGVAVSVVIVVMAVL